MTSIGGVRPVLVVGPPRSGTTWVEQVMGLAADSCSINEPDNDTQVPFALKAKRALGRYPVLDPGDEAPEDYARLWDGAFAGIRHSRNPRWKTGKLLLKLADKNEFRRALCTQVDPCLSLKLRAAIALASPPSDGTTAANVVVKSVHTSFSVSWIAERWQPKVVVVLRHPFNVVGSWAELGWGAGGGCSLFERSSVRRRYLDPMGIPLPQKRATSIELLTWQIALLTSALERTAAAHPEWQVVWHESLCLDPKTRFKELFHKVGLSWTEEAEAFLDSTKRVTSEQPGRWRTRLESDQVEKIRRVVSSFPLDAPPDALAT
ncbi:MAG: sulfotransferase [Actinomycetota bacterium]